MADQRVVVASTITLGRELIESTSLVSTSRGFESSTKIKTLTSRSKVKNSYKYLGIETMTMTIGSMTISSHSKKVSATRDNC